MNEAISRIMAEAADHIAVLTQRRDFLRQCEAGPTIKGADRDWIAVAKAEADALDAAIIAIAQQPSNAARGGYVIAPVVPTEAMIKAGYDAMNKHVAIGILPGDVYAAMIATLGEWQ